jgi:Flp pilus assembly pilin Flp
MLSPRHPIKPQPIKAGRGQSLAEYGLVLALVSVVAIEGLQLFGGIISGQLQQLAVTISMQPTSPSGSGGSFASNGNSSNAVAVTTPTSATSPPPAMTSPGNPDSPSSSDVTTPSVTATAATDCQGTASGCAINNNSGTWGF